MRFGILLLSWLLLSLVARAEKWGARFADPPAEYGMGVHWWWFGPAVTKPEVERELNVMHRAGIASVLIYPVYPISADDPARAIRNLRYLSPEYLDVLGHAVRFARQLGMTVEMVIGTGWPYGGPGVTPEHAARKLRVEGGAESPRIIDVPTGMNVKRASLGAEGLVLDHLNRGTVMNFLDEVGGKLLAAAGQGNVRAIHLDSLEVYDEEWTGDFAAEFARRRGYDLKPHLPALAHGSTDPLAADIRFDFWRTVSELARERFVQPLHEWCRSHGVALQAEAYGTPPVDMASYADVDDPAGESYDWKNFVASRWASSAAHQFGKRIVAAEAYTWLKYPRYVATLEDLKFGSDLHFVCGINRILAHGYNYSPPEAGVPGWSYYAAVELNENNTWWPYFPLLANYVRRASYALRHGRPQVDIAVYLPEEDVMAGQPIGNGLELYMETKTRLSGGARVSEFGLPSAVKSESPLFKTILAEGFNFDGFDHSLEAAGVRTSGGLLTAGDVSYRIAVLPNLKGISLSLLEILREFCRSGGVLVATRRLPDTAYGVINRDANSTRVRDIVDELFGAEAANGVRRRPYGRGMAIYVPDETVEFSSVLHSLGPAIDFGHPDPELAFVHRGDGSRHLYFLVNTSPQPKTFTPVFREGRGRPQFWDAMSGTVADAPSGRPAISLDGYGSIIVAFDEKADSARNEWPERRFLPSEAINVSGPWALEIDSRATPIGKLISWADLPAYRYYSGNATYRTTVRIPAGASRWWLDLGEVREIADVTLNHQPAGVVWKRPYTLDVTQWVHSGKNSIEVRVTNLLINRVLGQPDPDYSGLPSRRFPLPEEKKSIAHPLPSGLLGPVKLIPYEPVPHRRDR